jgi:exopolysaccharide production protein ExoQ
MPIKYAQAEVATEAPAPKKVGLLEQIVAGAVFIFPLNCTFVPFGEYFNESFAKNIHNSLYATPPPDESGRILSAATLVILLFFSFANWRAMLREARLMLPLIAMMGWIFASAIWSIEPDTALRHATHMMGHVIFSAYLIGRYGWREIIALLTNCYAVIVILCFGVMLIIPDLGYSNLVGYGDAWRGAFTQKNTLGSVAVFAILTACYSYYLGANNRFVNGFVCFGALFLLVMSRSATSTASLLMGAGFVIFVFGVAIHDRPFVRFLALMTMMTSMVVALILFGAYDSINDMLGRTANLTGRTAVWHYVMKIIEMKPWLGYGYAFWFIRSPIRWNLWAAADWPVPAAHNEWLDVTLQTGIIGLCIEASCFILALVRAARLLFVLKDGKALFCGVMLVVLGARTFSETVFTDPAISGWTWLIIIFLTLAHMVKEEVVVPSRFNVAFARERES